MAAAEAAATEPGAFLTVRTLRLTPEHGERLTTVLRDVASQPDDRDGQPYSLLPGLYEPDRGTPTRNVTGGALGRSRVCS